jgi:hypothetical protein
MHKLSRFLRVTFLWLVISPISLGLLGVCLNQAVLITNRDKFPVLMNEFAVEKNKIGPDGMLDDVHCVMTPYTHLNFLSDVFDDHGDIYSIGDLCMNTGAWLTPYLFVVWLTLVVKKLYEKDSEWQQPRYYQ